MPDKPICFVIAAIGEEGTETRNRAERIFTYLVEPVAAARGYDAIRADKISTQGIITDQVIQQVVSAKMVVADLTWHNANAFYELAVRHIANKPTVHLIKKGEKIPFDVAALRVLYVDDPDLPTIDKAKANLDRYFEDAERTSEGAHNPISVSLNLQALKQSNKPEIAQLAKLVQDLSAGVASLRSDVADLKNRGGGPVTFSGAGGMRVGEGWSIENVAKLAGVLPISYNVISGSPGTPKGALIRPRKPDGPKEPW